MNGLPTIDQIDYYNQLTNNNREMEDLLCQLFPDLCVPYEYVYQILAFLGETKINAQILPKVIRGVNNILMGTGKGQVIIHVSREVVNVSVRENDEEIKAIAK